MNRKEREKVRKTYRLLIDITETTFSKVEKDYLPLPRKVGYIFHIGIVIAAKTIVTAYKLRFPDILRLCSSCGELAGEDYVSFIEVDSIICQKCAKEEQ